MVCNEKAIPFNNNRKIRKQYILTIITIPTHSVIKIKKSHIISKATHPIIAQVDF